MWRRTIGGTEETRATITSASAAAAAAFDIKGMMRRRTRVGDAKHLLLSHAPRGKGADPCAMFLLG